jgi:hypothetical protein
MDEVTASVFGNMPGFDPFMYLNLSERCATTKLIQWFVLALLKPIPAIFTKCFCHDGAFELYLANAA